MLLLCRSEKPNSETSPNRQTPASSAGSSSSSSSSAPPARGSSPICAHSSSSRSLPKGVTRLVIAEPGRETKRKGGSVVGFVSCLEGRRAWEPLCAKQKLLIWRDRNQKMNEIQLLQVPANRNCMTNFPVMLRYYRRSMERNGYKHLRTQLLQTGRVRAHQ